MKPNSHRQPIVLPFCFEKNLMSCVWPKGEAYSAPLWVGYKLGNQIYRFGYSHPQIQDKTQNAVHSLIKSPHFKNYDKFKTGAYVYSGYNSPYSLW